MTRERDTRGRFAHGNRAAVGRRAGRDAEKVAKLRSALLDAITADDIRTVLRALKSEALNGNVPACRELLDRAVGKPIELDLLDRLDRLEALLERFADDPRSSDLAGQIRATLAGDEQGEQADLEAMEALP